MGSLQEAREVQRTGLDVGFLCAGWAPDVGGVESHAQDLARELMERGHRVHVLCLDRSGADEPFTTRTGDVEGVSVRRMAYAYGDHDRLARVVVNARAEDVVHAWTAETPCDVIHVHHLTGFGMGALRALSDVGAPLVMTLHDYWPLCPRGQMLRHDGALCARPESDVCGRCLASTWPHLMPSAAGLALGPRDEPLADDAAAAAARTAFALEMLALPARLFTPSAAARAVYVAAGVAPERISVCANGIEARELAAEVERLRADAGAPPGSPHASAAEIRLGVLGSVLPSKGVLELARALVAADAPGLVLEIHGDLPAYHGDDGYVRELRALAARDARVRVHGPYPRAGLAAILARLDGVAAPSRWQEVFGLSVREARAAGLPVLVSDAGGLAEVAGDGSAGLVVPRDDRDAWVAALTRFAREPGSRAAWAGAPASVRSAREMMLELERAYVEVVVESTGRAPELVHPLAPGPDAAPVEPGPDAAPLEHGRDAEPVEPSSDAAPAEPSTERAWPGRWLRRLRGALGRDQ